MPNIKSAKKRVLVNEQKNTENKRIKSAVKTEVKKIEVLVAEGKKEEALQALKTAYKMIDIAASKNVIHKNCAANKKSKLAKKINEMSNVETVKEEVKAEVAPEVAPATTEEAPKAKKTRKPKAEKTAEKAE